MTDLVLRAWRRSALYDLADGGRRDGRLTGSVPLVLRDRDNLADRVERNAPFVIAAARDVDGVTRSAIAAMAPPSGTLDAETTKAVHVEFHATDLPWRYTPGQATGARLKPWIVLLVGTDDEITLAGDIATVAPSVLDDHDLARSARWAHVDEGGERPVARLLSPRMIAPNASHLAILVKSYADDGAAAWATPAGGAAALSVLHHWRFRTDDAGDFVSLAARLKPRQAPQTLGRAPLHYDRIAPETVLETYGALAPVGAMAGPVPQPVADDLAALRAIPADPRNRPVIGLPDYGRDWLAAGQAATWSDALNGDPRFRVVGGLGRKAGIALQGLIADETERQSGALDMGHRLVADASLGLAAARSLFARRLPVDTLGRLWTLGPGVRRVATRAGTVHDQLSTGDRPMPPALLSSAAARRLFRMGGVLGRRARPGAVNPIAILRTSNLCPPRPETAPKGLPHVDHLLRFDEVLKRNLEGKTDPGPLIDRLRDLDLSDCPPEVQDRLKRLIETVVRLAEAGGDLPFAEIVRLISLVEGKKGRKPEVFLAAIARFFELFDRTGDSKDLGDFGGGLIRDPSPRPCRPTDLGALSEGLTAAFDPASPNAGTIVRLRDRITGLPEPFLQPPRFCPEIDLPLWRWLRDAAPVWLLPGSQAIDPDNVTALATNPRFVDAFMVGVNRQALAEFRWRNIRVAARCTPLKRFWDIAEPATGLTVDTIRPIRDWPAASPLGAIVHQPPSAGAADLVLVFRSPLFERYPGTVLYLLEAPMVAGEPDFDADPDLARPKVFPTFQGRLGTDITFFGFDVSPPEGRNYWAVLEEAAPAYRFRTVAADGWSAARVAAFNAARNNNSVDGARYAADTFNDPVRVMIRGTALVSEVP